jgi:hypothetical protein
MVSRTGHDQRNSSRDAVGQESDSRADITLPARRFGHILPGARERMQENTRRGRVSMDPAILAPLL